MRAGEGTSIGHLVTPAGHFRSETPHLGLARTRPFSDLCIAHISSAATELATTWQIAGEADMITCRSHRQC